MCSDVVYILSTPLYSLTQEHTSPAVTQRPGLLFILLNNTPDFNVFIFQLKIVKAICTLNPVTVGKPRIGISPMVGLRLFLSLSLSPVSSHSIHGAMRFTCADSDTGRPSFGSSLNFADPVLRQSQGRTSTVITCIVPLARRPIARLYSTSQQYLLAR